MEPRLSRPPILLPLFLHPLGARREAVKETSGEGFVRDKVGNIETEHPEAVHFTNIPAELWLEAVVPRGRSDPYLGPPWFVRNSGQNRSGAVFRCRFRRHFVTAPARARKKSPQNHRRIVFRWGAAAFRRPFSPGWRFFLTRAGGRTLRRKNWWASIQGLFFRAGAKSCSFNGIPQITAPRRVASLSSPLIPCGVSYRNQGRRKIAPNAAFALPGISDAAFGVSGARS